MRLPEFKRLPFMKGNIGYQHIHVVPLPPESASIKMQEVIMKCIEKKTSDRYQDVNELRHSLDTLYPPSKKGILKRYSN